MSFPWRSHRTIAEVYETDRLLERARVNRAALTPDELERLKLLLRKKRDNNPLQFDAPRGARFTRFDPGAFLAAHPEDSET